MEDKAGADPRTEFTSDSSSWSTLAEPDSAFNYFFDRESSVLSEFGWNILRPDHAEEIDRFGEIDGTDTTPAAACGSGSVTASNPSGSADVSTSNPSLSSSSSEDPTDKSTGSGGKPPEIP